MTNIFDGLDPTNEQLDLTKLKMLIILIHNCLKRNEKEGLKFASHLRSVRVFIRVFDVVNTLNKKSFTVEIEDDFTEWFTRLFILLVVQQNSCSILESIESAVCTSEEYEEIKAEDITLFTTKVSNEEEVVLLFISDALCHMLHY
mmetsp:Transcript_19400/g.22597  ORF Transcript_19400/g.22597 Transcript_19400/m.22597 type:complete len:145 (-) Transcript_19400:104-538(-)